MRVLYVDHTAQISGGERSLMDVLNALPSEVTPAVACPEGPLADMVREGQVPVFPIVGTDGSLRLHPVHTSEAAVAMLHAAAAIKRISARFEANLVHANSIRAGILASVAHRLGAPPAVVYVRDCLPPGLISSASLKLMGHGAACVLPNSRYTAQTLGERFSAPVRMVHSPIDLTSFDAPSVDPAVTRARLGLGEADLVLVVVAQLTPWKAQDDAIRILGLLRRTHDNVRLMLVGSAKFLSKATRYDNDAYRAWLGKLSVALGVEREVLFVGERHDVADILAASDIALLPSWEEPFGRSVIEAMAMKRPVVATNVGGPPEILTDGKEGLLLPPRAPELWAQAIDDLIEHPHRRAALGRAGQERVASQFSVERHIEAILDVYSETLGAGRPRPLRRTAAVA
jgi:L-malate glycosyltransferase